MDSGGIDSREGAVLDEMAELLSMHKLVPFFGAGISRRCLGFAAAGLAQQIAPLVHKPPETMLSDLADHFIDQLGEKAFVDFLKTKLTLTSVDDAKVSAHRLLLSLSISLLYTTNQDNIFELVADAYGRHYRRVVTLADITDATYSEPLLIKFHGDPEFPASLVFGKRSYDERIKAPGHPLDIKLRSDLQGKRLLFIGYSLQDENVSKLLLSVRHAFAGTMPPSYLLAYEYDPSMDDLAATYGIQVINPRRLCPSAKTNEEAFDRCLQALGDRTIKVQASRGLEALFSNDVVNYRMVTDFEIAAIGKAANTEPVEVAVRAFRGVCDRAVVPISLRQQVVEVFCRLCQRADASSDSDISGLKGALFNLTLAPEFAIQAMAALMILGNRRPPQSGLFDDLAVLLCPALPDGTQPIAAAVAVARMSESGEPITDNFRRLAHLWFQGFRDVPPEQEELVKTTISMAWSGFHSADSPLTRPESPFRAKGFHTISFDLLSKLPTKFRRPRH